MADEISAEILLLYDKFIQGTKETTGSLTTLGQRFDAIFEQINKTSDANTNAVIDHLKKLDSSFKASVESMKATTDSLKFDKLGQAFEQIGEKAKGIFTGSVNDAAGFESQINQIRAISDLSGKDIQLLSSRVKELGKEYGFAVGPTETAAIALQAVGSGFESVNESTQIAKSALALIADGTTSATNATKLLTGSLNAYGQGADQAAKFTDVYFQIQNRGVVTISELSQTLGLVTKPAAEAGVSIEELGASVIVATKNAVPFTSSVEGLRGLLANLTSPSAEATRAMQKYGISVDYTTLKQKGLGGTLKEIKTAIGNDSAALRDIAGSQQAFALATVLTSDNLKAFNQEVGGLQNATGAAAKSTTILAEGFTNSQKAFDAALERFKIGVAEELLPVGTKLIKFASDAVDAFNKIPQPIKNFGLVCAGVAAAVGLLAGTILSAKGVLGLLGFEGAAAAAGVKLAGASITGFLSLPLADGLGKVANGMKNLGSAAFNSASINIPKFSQAFQSIPGALQVFAGSVAGTLTLFAGLAIGIGVATKSWVDYSNAINEAEIAAMRADRGFAALGKQVTEIRTEDAIGLDVSTLKDIGVTPADIQNRVSIERNRLSQDQDADERARRLKTIDDLKAKEKELAEFIAKENSKPEQARQSAAAEKEAYKDAFQRVQLSKEDSATKITQYQALILQYRLFGDERRQVEREIAQEEDRAAKKKSADLKKARDEAVKNLIQEAENAKSTDEQKAASLKKLLAKYVLTGNERRLIEDKVLAYEKKAQAEREKIADRNLKIAKEAADDRIKTAEREQEKLQKLEGKDVDTSSQQAAQVKKKAQAQKDQIDTQLTRDLAKETDPANRTDLKNQAKREKSSIDADANAEIDQIAETGYQNRLQREADYAKSSVELETKRLDKIKKYVESGNSNLEFFKAAALERLALQEKEIEAQQRLAEAQTRDPQKIAQIEEEAENRKREARQATREEIEATTKAIEDQKKKAEAGKSKEFGGNILSLEQFIKGESDRFNGDGGRDLYEKLVKKDRKKAFVPGLDDSLIQNLDFERKRDPAGKNRLPEPGGQSQKPVALDVKGTFRLEDSSGREIGHLSKLSVNGENSELADLAKGYPGGA